MFAPIGPYSLTRVDLAAAGLAISFRLGGPAVLIRSWVLILCGAIVLLGGFFTSDWLFSVIVAAAIAFMFLSPALRSTDRVCGILLGPDPDGIVAENNGTRTLYKWSTIRPSRRIGSRFFLMVTPGCALVIPERATTPENLDALVATVRDHASDL